MNSSLASIHAYDAQASVLAERYEALSSADVFSGLLDHFPLEGGARVLDIGAGSGRDAAWLALLGNDVVAAEPSAAMRAQATARHGVAARWIEDSLPDLANIRSLGTRYDFILLSAVFMHVHAEDRARAMQTVAALLEKNGTCILSLRCGPPDPDRAMYAVTPNEVLSLAAASGLRPVGSISDETDRLGRTEIRWSAFVLRVA